MDDSLSLYSLIEQIYYHVNLVLDYFGEKQVSFSEQPLENWEKLKGFLIDIEIQQTGYIDRTPLAKRGEDPMLYYKNIFGNRFVVGGDLSVKYYFHVGGQYNSYYFKVTGLEILNPDTEFIFKTDLDIRADCVKWNGVARPTKIHFGNRPSFAPGSTDFGLYLKDYALFNMIGSMKRTDLFRINPETTQIVFSLECIKKISDCRTYDFTNISQMVECLSDVRFADDSFNDTPPLKEILRDRCIFDPVLLRLTDKFNQRTKNVYLSGLYTISTDTLEIMCQDE